MELRSFLTPWPWVTIAVALVAISAGTLAYAEPEPGAYVDVCADEPTHDESVLCYLAELSAGSFVVTGTASFLGTVGPTLAVLGVASVAVGLARWVPRG